MQQKPATGLLRAAERRSGDAVPDKKDPIAGALSYTWSQRADSRMPAASTACRRLRAHAHSPAHAHAFARPRGLTASNPGTFVYKKRAPLLGPSHIHGANERIRTADLRITSALLYQLSHVGICNAGALRSPTVVNLTWYWRSSQASTNLFYLPSCVMTPRITPCVDAAAFSPASSASSWLLSIIPALLVTSVMPRTSMPSALAMMASHTVEQPT